MSPDRRGWRLRGGSCRVPPAGVHLERVASPWPLVVKPEEGISWENEKKVSCFHNYCYHLFWKQNNNKKAHVNKTYVLISSYIAKIFSICVVRKTFQFNIFIMIYMNLQNQESDGTSPWRPRRAAFGGDGGRRMAMADDRKSRRARSEAGGHCSPRT
jgi:hypothetical protein